MTRAGNPGSVRILPEHLRLEKCASLRRARARVSRGEKEPASGILRRATGSSSRALKRVTTVRVCNSQGLRKRASEPAFICIAHARAQHRGPSIASRGRGRFERELPGEMRGGGYCLFLQPVELSCECSSLCSLLSSYFDYSFFFVREEGSFLAAFIALACIYAGVYLKFVADDWALVVGTNEPAKSKFLIRARI